MIANDVNGMGGIWDRHLWGFIFLWYIMIKVVIMMMTVKWVIDLSTLNIIFIFIDFSKNSMTIRFVFNLSL